MIISYSLDAFRRRFGGVFPENAIIPHDLSALLTEGRGDDTTPSLETLCAAASLR